MEEKRSEGESPYEISWLPQMLLNNFPCEIFGALKCDSGMYNKAGGGGESQILTHEMFISQWRVEM